MGSGVGDSASDGGNGSGHGDGAERGVLLVARRLQHGELVILVLGHVQSGCDVCHILVRWGVLHRQRVLLEQHKLWLHIREWIIPGKRHDLHRGLLRGGLLPAGESDGVFGHFQNGLFKRVFLEHGGVHAGADVRGGFVPGIRGVLPHLDRFVRGVVCERVYGGGCRVHIGRGVYAECLPDRGSVLHESGDSVRDRDLEHMQRNVHGHRCGVFAQPVRRSVLHSDGVHFRCGDVVYERILLGGGDDVRDGDVRGGVLPRGAVCGRAACGMQQHVSRRGDDVRAEPVLPGGLQSVGRAECSGHL